jgi:taurine dioxygenase
MKSSPSPTRRAHPSGNGRRALFVSEHFTTRIVGLPDDESRAVLDELLPTACAPNTCMPPLAAARPGVLGQPLADALATGCPSDLRRKLYRTTIEGDAPY